MLNLVMDTEAMDMVDTDMVMVSLMVVPMEDMAMDMDTEAMVMENDEKLDLLGICSIISTNANLE